MDRKFCVLLYSDYSKASIELINYIKNIPLDFPTMVGLTMICIDNPDFKKILYDNQIKYVPTLLVEYYNGTKQKFERDSIYLWINQIMNRFASQESFKQQPNVLPGRSIDKELVSSDPVRKKKETSPLKQSDQESVFEKKLDISSIALEMQKHRDLDLAEIREKQKPI